MGWALRPLLAAPGAALGCEGHTRHRRLLMDVRPLRPQPWTVRAPRSSSPDEVRPAETPFRGMLLTGDLITAPTSLLQRDVTPQRGLSLPPPNRPPGLKGEPHTTGGRPWGLAMEAALIHSFIHSRLCCTPARCQALPHTPPCPQVRTTQSGEFLRRPRWGSRDLRPLTPAGVDLPSRCGGRAVPPSCHVCGETQSVIVSEAGSLQR